MPAKIAITDASSAIILCRVGLHAFLAGIIGDDAFSRSAMARIIEAGRYSRQVIAFARECRQENISFALP
jgi:sugar/nucleoside kinase (ribokinase family)